MRVTDSDKTQKAIYRAGRLFRTNKGWFVDTREGHQGPFQTHEMAICVANHYARRMTDGGHLP